MIQVENVLLSDELFTESFACDLGKCKGACCVEGESGAPLEEREVHLLEDIQDELQPYLTEKGKKALKEQGAFIIDSDGDYVTPLVEGKECAYTTFDDNGTAKCGIEQAHLEGAVSFLKPASCHLYPIRITQLAEMEALNYHRWPICDPARVCGMDLKLPVFRFLKLPLTRRYGAEWFALLEEAFFVWKKEGRG